MSLGLDRGEGLEGLELGLPPPKFEFPLLLGESNLGLSDLGDSNRGDSCLGDSNLGLCCLGASNLGLCCLGVSNLGDSADLFDLLLLSLL